MTSQPFYSHAEQVIKDKLPNVAHPDHVRKTLHNAGVKPEEMKWSGLDEHLGSATGPVRKEDLLNTVRTKCVKINEVVKTPTPEDRYHDGDLDQIMSSNSQDTKFERYQLPGGSNYKELLFQLPLSPDKQTIADRRGYGSPNEDLGVYHSSHWYEPNVLAHVRFNDRTGPNGEKLLHIEEVQSDWHQAGRKHGYKGDNARQDYIRDKIKELVDKRAAIRSKIKEDFERIKNSPDDSDDAVDQYSNIKTLHDDIQRGSLGNFLTLEEKHLHHNKFLNGEWLDSASLDKHRHLLGDRKKVAANHTKFLEQYLPLIREWDSAVHQEMDLRHELSSSSDQPPDAPFKKTWHELALKRMIRWAAEHGYHGITWTPGSEQAKRYLGQITGHPDEEGIDENQEKIVNGMHGFYDKIIPTFLNNYGKRFHTQVGITQIPQDHDASNNRQFYNINRALEAFNRGGEVYGVDRYGHESLITSTQEMRDHPWRAFVHGDKQPNMTVPYFPIPQSMRDHVMYKGQAQYKRRYAGRSRYSAETQSVAGALQSSASNNQRSVVDVAKDITHELGLLPAVATDTVHYAPNGSRASLMLKLNHGGQPVKADYAASWFGLMTKQPGVVVFNQGEGPDLLHTTHTPMSGEDVLPHFRRYGINDLIMVPERNGFKVVVYDKEAKLGAQLNQLVRNIKGKLESQRGTGKFIGSHSEQDTREAYRRIIRGYENQGEQDGRVNLSKIRNGRAGEVVRMAKNSWLVKPSKLKADRLLGNYKYAIERGLDPKLAARFAGYAAERHLQGGGTRHLNPTSGQMEYTLPQILMAQARRSGNRFSNGINGDNYEKAFISHIPLMDEHPQGIPQIDPRWRTSTVLDLAHHVNNHPEGIKALPYLSDALAEAGCDNDEMHRHCRTDLHQELGITSPKSYSWVAGLLLNEPKKKEEANASSHGS